MQAYLEIVTIVDALIQAQKCVPRLIVGGVTDDAEALPGESPNKGIGESGANHRGVSEGEPFAVVAGGLLRRVARQEGGPRVAQILRGAAPEQQVLAVSGEPVIDSSNKNVVIQLGGRPENESGIVESISGGRVVRHRLTGAECFVEIAGVANEIDHGRINPYTSWVEVLQVRGHKCD